jgi:hypothetical protein
MAARHPVVYGLNLGLTALSGSDGIHAIVRSLSTAGRLQREDAACRRQQ